MATKDEVKSWNRPRDKYCRFHRYHDHDTEDCIDPGNWLEKMIHKGALLKFVASNLWPFEPQGALGDKGETRKGPVLPKTSLLLERYIQSLREGCLVP